MIDKVTLAPNLEISPIITGLWQIADMERKKEIDIKHTSSFMAKYVESGLSSFDMADHYGSSEIIAGHFFKNSNIGKLAQLFTKWVPEPGEINKDTVRSAVTLALKRTQQDALDLLQYHAWHYPDPSWLDSLFYLKELKEEGLIRHIGVTNFDSAHLRIACASGIPIVSNQISHSVLDQRANKEIVDVCEEYGVKLLAYGTLAGGFLTEKWHNRPEPKKNQLKTWSEMKYKRFIDVVGGWDLYQNLLSAMKQIADKHNATIANIATRYVFENPKIIAVIIGARLGEKEHIEENKRLLEIDLTKEDLELIDLAQKELNPVPGDCGDEYRKPPYLTAAGDLSHHVKNIPKSYDSEKNIKGREQIFSNTIWEEFAGYCRAIKSGNKIYVSGTTATHGQRLIGGTDPAAQTHFVIDKIQGAIESLGGDLADVVRTRIYVNKINDWEPVARAHGERFKNINPSNTLVQSGLIGDDYLVEIEAEAEIE